MPYGLRFVTFFCIGMTIAESEALKAEVPSLNRNATYRRRPASRLSSNCSFRIGGTFYNCLNRPLESDEFYRAPVRPYPVIDAPTGHLALVINSFFAIYNRIA